MSKLENRLKIFSLYVDYYIINAFKSLNIL